MSGDIFGLGIEGLGYGGFAAATYSTHGIRLDNRQQQNNAQASSSSSSTSSSTTAESDPAQRKRQVAAVVELLEKHRGVLSFSQLFSLSDLDLTHLHHQRLAADLAKNTKVTLDADKQTIAYKSKYPHIQNAVDVLKEVNSHPFGVTEDSLLDCYHGIEGDIEQLVQTKQIYRLRPPPPRAGAAAAAGPTATTDGDVVPPPSTSKRKDTYSLLVPRRASLEVDIDPRISSLWQEVHVPANTVDLDTLLLQHELMTAKQLKRAQLTVSAQVRGEFKRKKSGKAAQPRKRYRQHLTNIHLLNQQGYAWLSKTSSHTPQEAAAAYTIGGAPPQQPPATTQ